MIGDGTAKYSNAQGLLLVVDTVAMIQCRPLFRLKGDSVRQCGYTGWSGNPSYCERKKLFHYETIIFKAKKYFPPDNIFIFQYISHHISYRDVKRKEVSILYN